MIKNIQPLSLAETKKLLAEREKKMKELKDDRDDRVDSVNAYLKKFSKLSIDKAKKMKEELEKLDLIQLKPQHILKITDILPADAEDLHKILIGESVSLDKNEIDKILEIVKTNIK